MVRRSWWYSQEIPEDDRKGALEVETRGEPVDSEIHAMAGANETHNTLQGFLRRSGGRVSRETSGRLVSRETSGGGACKVSRETSGGGTCKVSRETSGSGNRRGNPRTPT